MLRLLLRCGALDILLFVLCGLMVLCFPSGCLADPLSSNPACNATCSGAACNCTIKMYYSQSIAQINILDECGGVTYPLQSVANSFTSWTGPRGIYNVNWRVSVAGRARQVPADITTPIQCPPGQNAHVYLCSQLCDCIGNGTADSDCTATGDCCQGMCAACGTNCTYCDVATTISANVTEIRESASTIDNGLSGSIAGTGDDANTLTYQIEGGSISASNSIASGGYGNLTLGLTSGSYAYLKNSPAIEALDDGEGGTDTFTLTIRDGSNNTVLTKTLTVTIVGADDPPTLATVANGTVAEVNQTSASIDSNLSGTLVGSDIDVESLTYGIAVGNITVSTQIGVYGNLTVNSTSGAYVYTKNIATINALDNGESGIDAFSFTVSDGDDGFVSTYFQVLVIGAGDLPVNTVPTAQSTLANSSITFSSVNGTLLSVTDPDSKTLQVALSVSHGTITLATTNNLSFGTGDGIDDSSMTFSGNLSSLNAALNGLVYHPSANYVGADLFVMFSSDGTSGDNDTVALTVNATVSSPPPSCAQVGNFTETFDALSNTASTTTNDIAGLLVNPFGQWTLTETGGGIRDNERYGVDTGSGTSGDVLSYGAAGSTDRALGTLLSGTVTPLFGFYYTNIGDSTITRISVAYTGEEWRLGTSSRTDQLNFEFSMDTTDLANGTWTNVPTLNFLTPDTTGTAGSRSGNSASNRTNIQGDITSLSIDPGQTIWIRFRDLDATGADDGLAVDDFTFITYTC